MPKLVRRVPANSFFIRPPPRKSVRPIAGEEPRLIGHQTLKFGTSCAHHLSYDVLLRLPRVKRNHPAKGGGIPFHPPAPTHRRRDASPSANPHLTA